MSIKLSIITGHLEMSSSQTKAPTEGGVKQNLQQILTYSPIRTADADATQLLSRVGVARCVLKSVRGAFMGPLAPAPPPPLEVKIFCNNF